MGTNKTACLCIFALLLANSALLAHGQRVPFKLHGNHLLVVQGSLGRLNKRNFLLDTGANPSVVDEQVAQQASVQPLTTQPGTMDVVSGRIDSHYATLSSLQLGPVSRQSLPVAIADLSFLRAQVGTRIDAVVGLDVLGQNSFRIDYENKVIIFGPIEASAASVPFGSGPPLVTVPMMVDNKPVRVLVDTGTDGLILFRDHLAGWDARLSSGSAQISDLAGGASLPMIQASETRVGDIEMGARNVYIADGHNCCRFDGLLGIAAPRVKEIGFDFEHNLITWQFQDRAIPTMSEAGPGNCLPPAAPGLAPRAPAAGFAETSGCSAVLRPRLAPIRER